MIRESVAYPEVARGRANQGLTLVMARDDIARGFTKRPADTLSVFWTYVSGTDAEMKNKFKAKPTLALPAFSN